MKYMYIYSLKYIYLLLTALYELKCFYLWQLKVRNIIYQRIKWCTIARLQHVFFFTLYIGAENCNSLTFTPCIRHISQFIIWSLYSFEQLHEDKAMLHFSRTQKAPYSRSEIVNEPNTTACILYDPIIRK